MIRNRNVASDAFIDPSKIAGNMCAETYYVADGSMYSWLESRVPGGHLFKPSSTNASTVIDTVIDKCVSGRGDKIVLAGNMTVTSAFTVDKDALKICGFAPNNCPTGGEVRISSSSSDIMKISANKVEVSGIRFNQTGAYSAIYVEGSSALAAQLWLHDLAIYCNNASALGSR